MAFEGQRRGESSLTSVTPRLELASVFACQIPDATVVDELVGFDGAVAFATFKFEVIKPDALVVADGLFNLTEQSFFAAQVFVVIAFNQQRAICISGS